ncbi:MAG: MFS transporter [Treponema sp.]|nr:MFS transporter [Treponema sp.]
MSLPPTPPQAGGRRAPHGDSYKWLALSATSLGALMSVMSGSMLLIALPSIVRDLDTSMALVVWVIMSYMLAITVLVPAIGRVADMIGRKRLYIGGFALFTVMSLIAAMAKTGAELLVARIVQAVGGSLIMANSTAIVADAFPKEELGRALGINTMVIAVGSAIGPVIGGFVTERFGWRGTFFLSVPVGLVGTVWAWLQIRETAVLPEGQSFDTRGALLVVSGLFLLFMSLSFGGFYGWSSPLVLGGFVGAAILLALFVRVETGAAEPLFDLRLFKTRVLAFAYASNLLNGIARGALTFLLIFYLQGLRAMDPLTAGIFLTPFALAMMLSAPVSGLLSDRHGSRVLSTVGLGLSAVGLLGFTWIKADTSLAEIVLWQVLMGLGSGIFNSPNTNTIMGSVPVERRGIAAGTRTMMNNTGSVISIAMTFGVLSSGMTPKAMAALFAGTQIGSEGIFLNVFLRDLHVAFVTCFVISVAAAVIAYMRGPTPAWSKGSAPGR